MTDHVTSDTHWWHNNILGFPSCDKQRKDLYGEKENPASVHAMNEGMIKIWNQHVQPGDTVYHLGDFVIAYGKNLEPRTRDILRFLNGKIILIGGNHDNHITKRLFKEFGHEVFDYKEINFSDGKSKGFVKVCMSHYPFAAWNKSHHGSIMLHGHSHGSYKAPGGRILDVGWDVHGRPLTMKEAVDICLKKQIFSADHHGA